MWKSRGEIKKTYVDHLDSVRMSGFGHETFQSDILSHMLEALRLFDEGERSPSFDMLH